jgi:ABC-type multidrug transport system ATPase subunit
MTVKDSDGRNGFVVLSGVSKRYGSLLALDGVSFEVEEGEIFG